MLLYNSGYKFYAGVSILAQLHQMLSAAKKTFFKYVFKSAQKLMIDMIPDCLK